MFFQASPSVGNNLLCWVASSVYIISAKNSGIITINIAKILYRSPAFIKSILDRVGVPQRPSSLEDRKMPTLLPENCIAEEFEKGEIVWSAAYHAPAEICKEYEDKRSMYLDRYGSRCYSIYVYEKSSEDIYYSGVGGFYAASCAYDLGKLSHIEDMGIDIRKQVAWELKKMLN